ncbi:uncharacterized protein LOC120251298 [Dioscorea cayenensis subsp. rotundata]|uniref:Uncharacterized protein LOC120251298 n=1 Tax=Dioscorea cayennensis subsp. rotundata TaxID=55577 RepID=A0AB40ALZ3_DIOCR|nr:uncharacterized protein LOC120251298 [Dioscorea cayenensis subsp. rotundata]
MGIDHHDNVKLGKQSPPGIAPFDHSVDGFFATMDSISALCGEPSCEGFLLSQIERFSSMIMFLKEWRQFYYEPKVLNFSYESESGQVSNFSEGITLQQFSSASVSVPEVESLPQNVRSSSSDFVLHVGGSVWALDWCPRTDEKTEGQANCEYLAVAAHPSGASYHKIGVPLVGRGLIQIWCLTSLDKKNELSQAKPKGRGRQKINLKQSETELSHELNQNEFSATRRKRGRPRKRQAEDDALCDSDNKKILHLPKPRGRPRKIEKLSTDDLSRGEILPARPRGRPRKHMNRGFNRPDSVNGLILGRFIRTLESVDGREAPPSTDHVSLSTMHCVSVLNVDAGDAPKRRERPRREPLSSTNKFRRESVFELQVDASGNGALTSTENCMAPSHIGLGNIASLSVTSGNLIVEKESCVCSVDDIATCSVEVDVEAYGSNLISSRSDCLPCLNADLQHVALPLTTSAGSIIKEKSFVSGFHGQPRESTISSAKKGVLTPGVDIESNASDSSLTLNSNESMTPLNSRSGNATMFPTSGNTHAEEKSFVPRPGGRPIDQFIQSTSKTVSTSGADFKLFSNLELANSRENLISGDCQSELIVSDSCEGVTNRREETIPCSHILENIALPRMLMVSLMRWWDVPHPSLVRRLYISSRIEGTDPRFIKLEPVFKCSKIKCGDRQWYDDLVLDLAYPLKNLSSCKASSDARNLRAQAQTCSGKQLKVDENQKFFDPSAN